MVIWTADPLSTVGGEAYTTIVDGNIVRKPDGRVLMSLSELAMTAQYNPVHSEHITAESTYTIRNNAYSFGCTFAEGEVAVC